MQTSTTTKIIAIAVYALGAAIVAALVVLYICGASYVPFPDAMLPATLSEIAFEYAAIGAIPMTLASLIMYNFVGIKNSVHRRRNAVFLFLPAAICGGCVMYFIGMFVVFLVKNA